MILWVILAIMTVIAVLVVLVPLARRRADDEATDASDVAVYKDQLNEVKQDFNRGLLAEPEAQAARAEIARRLLKAADSETAKEKAGKNKAGFIRKLTSGIVLACIPGFSLGIYLLTGAPDLPSQPFAERQVVNTPKSLAQADTTKMLIARAETHLAKNPDDIRGWQILAPIYTRLRRFSDASYALRRVMTLSGGSPQATADYGESLIMGNRGEVPPAALEVFRKLLKTNPNMPRPRHYIALADAQAGRLKQAAAKWRALLASSPQNVPWRADIEGLAARAEGKAPKVKLSSLPPVSSGVVNTPANSQLPALSKEQMSAARSMDAKSRQQMIAGMVKRLSDRLAKNGGPVSEWIKLARAQQVLGNEASAKTALKSAQAAYAGKPEALKQLNNAGLQMGIESIDKVDGQTPAASSDTSTLPQGSKLPQLSNEQMKAASAMDATSRQQMIAGMVKRLSDRLAENGGTVSEWIKLARTHKVLGDIASAKAALASAQTAYANEPEALKQLNTARSQLGIEP